jgi:hypothetical protein
MCRCALGNPPEFLKYTLDFSPSAYLRPAPNALMQSATGKTSCCIHLKIWFLIVPGGNFVGVASLCQSNRRFLTCCNI